MIITPTLLDKFGIRNKGAIGRLSNSSSYFIVIPPVITTPSICAEKVQAQWKTPGILYRVRQLDSHVIYSFTVEGFKLTTDTKAFIAVLDTNMNYIIKSRDKTLKSTTSELTVNVTLEQKSDIFIGILLADVKSDNGFVITSMDFSLMSEKICSTATCTDSESSCNNSIINISKNTTIESSHCQKHLIVSSSKKVNLFLTKQKLGFMLSVTQMDCGKAVFIEYDDDIVICNKHSHNSTNGKLSNISIMLVQTPEGTLKNKNGENYKTKASSEAEYQYVLFGDTSKA